MYSRADRNSLAGIHGITSSTSSWPPGPPVPIVMPSNGFRSQEPAPTSTRTINPYDRQKRNLRPVGNPTSRSTLVQAGPSRTSPPQKRQKLDHHAPHSKGKNKDSPIVLPDEDINSDDLNIRSDTRSTRPSKHSSDMGLKSSSKPFSIFDDGDTTKEIAPRYSSDPIEQFSEITRKRGGLVSSVVTQLETHNLKKVDLRSKMKGKSKGKGTLLMTWTQTANPQFEDQPDRIPVLSVLSNAERWQSAPHQQLWMYTRHKRLFIEENSKTVVNKPLVDNAYMMTLAQPSEVESSSVPTIQFTPKNHKKETITIRLDTQHSKDSRWNTGAYIRFVDALKKLGVQKEVMRSEHTARLWETAEQNANETLKHKISTTEPELKEIQSKPRQTNIDPSRSWQATTTTTTTLKRKAELDSPDAQAASPRCQPGIEAGPSRHKPIALSTERNLRSRKKVALDIEPVPSAHTNPDEVVLSYPAGLPGAVNITNVDLERLNPGAFLNDTLIEFGLKVWLKDLENSNPKLANQIHVFSSFFYKKLNSKKDLQVAYESVRKWTNKFDIFQKKYIIVPINENLHWYLAIIYEPEHILKDLPANHKSPPRPQTRLSTAQAISEIDSNSSRICQRLDSLETQMDDLGQHSEVEVERDLGDFKSSCTIEDHVPRQADNHSDIYEPLSHSVMASPNHRVSTMVSEYDTSSPAAVAPPVSAKGRRSLRTVDAERFYQSPTQQQYGKKKKAQSDARSPGMDVDPHERDEVEIIDDIPRTYIFTFDSLGTRHLQAIRRLSAYLKMEAKSKKGVDAGGVMDGKSAPVPCQTNFCDCGIYLLHFAQTFMSDPRKYANIILSQRPKSTGDTERKAIWLVDNDFEPEGRQRLRLRIEALSKDWKKLRDGAQKQLEEVRDDESEGEVELVESDSGKHSKSRRKSQPQGEKTGPASRVRG